MINFFCFSLVHVFLFISNQVAEGLTLVWQHIYYLFLLDMVAIVKDEGLFANSSLMISGVFVTFSTILIEKSFFHSSRLVQSFFHTPRLVLSS